MRPAINELKRDVFYRMLDMADRVFIVARYAENVIIGNRGFTEDEKKNGIVLVFNKSMNFSWDDFGITSTLVFGTSPQKCFIPADDIVAVYSPELSAQFITAHQVPAEPAEKSDKAGTEPGREEKAESKVVKVDFSRKRTAKRTDPTHHRKGGRHES
jgi:hypothetical protein